MKTAEQYAAEADEHLTNAFRAPNESSEKRRIALAQVSATLAVAVAIREQTAAIYKQKALHRTRAAASEAGIRYSD